MKLGLCCGGPMNGKVYISHLDYYIPKGAITFYIKKFYTGGVYQWVVKKS